MEQSKKRRIASRETQEGATAFITHHVREGQEELYENWLKEIGAKCKTYPGYLDTHVIRPIPGLTGTYSVMIRFDTPEHLHLWVQSDDRKSLIEKVQPILGNGDDIYVKSGLDFWFTPEGAKAQLPTRWKQFLVTWSAIFPLSLVVNLLLVSPLMQLLGIPANFYLKAFVATGLVVWAMVYVVMPRYTRLVQRWLFDEK